MWWSFTSHTAHVVVMELTDITPTALRRRLAVSRLVAAATCIIGWVSASYLTLVLFSGAGLGDSPVRAISTATLGFVYAIIAAQFYRVQSRQMAARIIRGVQVRDGNVTWMGGVHPASRTASNSH